MSSESDTLLARLDERYNALNDKLDAILLQVTKTNGRVDTHSAHIDEINRWKHETIGFNRGSWKTSSIFGAIAGAVGAWIMTFLKH